MKLRNLYKHNNCIDVVFQPTSIREADHALEIQGWWFNISTDKLIRIDIDKITIKNEDLPNWKIYEHKITSS
jgi:hypothetical protein